MGSLISVVVPVYNVEKYLDRCINSIVHQSYKKLEVVLVDDGSTDSSGAICERWASSDDRIHVVHKENAGLGLARNSGLAFCSGEYIAFVDSDDFLEENAFERMIEELWKCDADTCYCSHQTFSNERKSVLERYPKKCGVYSGTEILLDILGSNPEEPADVIREMSVWGALFSAKLIKGHSLRFVSEREYICEDLPFDVQYLSKAFKVVVIQDCLYDYCMNSESLTHKYYSDRIDREKKLYFYICQLMDSLMPYVEYRLRYNRLFLGRVRNCILQEVNDSKKTYQNVMDGIRKIADDKLVSSIVKAYPIYKTPFRQRVFNISLKYKIYGLIYLLAKLQHRKQRSRYVDNNQ